MHRAARRTAVLATASALCLLAACEPMQISPVLDRPATLEEGARPGSTDLVTLTGTISCTRSEPVDLFIDIRQGTVDGGEERSVPCGPGDPQPWSTTFPVDPAFVPGRAGVEITFCTNPWKPIDEDCVTVSRGVDLKPPA